MYEHFSQNIGKKLKLSDLNAYATARTDLVKLHLLLLHLQLTSSPLRMSHLLERKESEILGHTPATPGVLVLDRLEVSLESAGVVIWQYTPHSV